jgi:ubiquinone/menaquinone biosynthesis C-methylase UbiE
MLSLEEEWGCRVTGVDPSPEMLERRRFPRPEELVDQLEGAGFATAWWRALPSRRRSS